MNSWGKVAFLLLVLSPAAFGQTMTVPPTVSVDQPGLVIVRPTSVDGDDFCWDSLSPGLQLIPSDLLARKDVAVGYTNLPGVYKLRARCTKAVSGKGVLSPPYDVVVTVGGVPPTPIPPTPIPPGPVDPLVKALQEAYDAESAAGKSTQLSNYIAVIDRAAVRAQSGQITTVKQLADAVHTDTETTVGQAGQGAFVKVRTAGTAYIKSAGLPTIDGPITQDTRDKASVTYTKLATALRQVR